MKTLIGIALLASASVALAGTPPLESLPPDRPVVDGMLSKAAIHQVAFLHRGEIQACYQAALKTKPGLAGKLVARFVIESTGSVSHVQIATSTLRSSTIENCVVNHVSRWRFPRPARGGRVAVVYPWLLRTTGNG
jgi:hypothetical protein